MSYIRMSIDISRDLHKIIKTLSLLKSSTIRDYVVEAITDKILKESYLNEETIKILEKSDKGLDLNMYDDLEDLYKKIGV